MTVIDWNRLSQWDDLSILDISYEIVPKDNPYIFPGAIFSNYKKLDHAIISNGNFPQINSGYGYQSSSSLTILQLLRSRIRTLGRNSFSDLKNVSILMLSENLLQIIPNDAFVNSPSLKIIDLIKNLIDEIEDYAFVGVPNLVTLRLSSNRLRKINPNVFKGLSNLKYLLLQNNRIHSINEPWFASLSNLRSLRLHNNSLVEFRPIALKGLTELNFVELLRNKLTSLDDRHFRYSRKLTGIDLRGNLFKTLKRSWFEPLVFKEPDGTRLAITCNPLEYSCDLQWLLSARTDELNASYESMNSNASYSINCPQIQLLPDNNFKFSKNEKTKNGCEDPFTMTESLSTTSDLHLCCVTTGEPDMMLTNGDPVTGTTNAILTATPSCKTTELLPLLIRDRHKMIDFESDPAHYEHISIVGRGMNDNAIVSAVRHNPSGEFIAIKRVLLDKCKEDWECIQREIVETRQLQHPNILPYLHSFVTNNEVWTITPLMTYALELVQTTEI
ncbi:Platelet glycoprotein V [Nymphon striatum]|nr:Platelet glycoprotein V [Nymphon striatum]